ncbi:glutamine amidotransferase [Candidatus Saccharibacteria bacterium]|nr:glutamine amidotransferase [Candidatus Saccharibacteria bacterium]
MTTKHPATTKPLCILHLYPNEMNLYGDHGNILTLKKRCEWRNIPVEILTYELGEAFPDPSNIDIIFGGGGQDSGQSKIAADLLKIAPILKNAINAGTPTLVICGLYQLFGKAFHTADGNTLEGAAILDLETTAGDTRLIGNITLKTAHFGTVVGYENHSGLTALNLPNGSQPSSLNSSKNRPASHSDTQPLLSPTLQPFGTVVKGAGNNNTDQTEGAIYKNCIATYLHGPLLPKNPKIADFLIETALARRSTNATPSLTPLDDALELQAKDTALSRPR